MMLVISPQYTTAQESDARDELLACDTLKSPEERLQCFNKILEKLKTGQATRKPKSEPKKEGPAKDQAPEREEDKTTDQPKTNPEDNFGFTKAQIEKRTENEGRKRGELNLLQATVKKHWRTYAGQFVMELDNGQVWAAGNGNYRKLPRKGTITVEIKKSTMGGFRMKINGGKRAYRVKRVK